MKKYHGNSKEAKREKVIREEVISLLAGQEPKIK